MTKPNEINYICAHWRDANTDPPEYSSVPVVVKSGGNIQDLRFHARNGMWVAPDWADGDYDEIEIEPGDQWLDVTDIPAIPRAQVQAAVDELHAEAARRDVRTHGYGCNDDLIYTLEVLRDECGITPTEVQS